MQREIQYYNQTDNESTRDLTDSELNDTVVHVPTTIKAFVESRPYNLNPH